MTMYGCVNDKWGGKIFQFTVIKETDKYYFFDPEKVTALFDSKPYGNRIEKKYCSLHIATCIDLALANLQYQLDNEMRQVRKYEIKMTELNNMKVLNTDIKNIL